MAHRDCAPLTYSASGRALFSGMFSAWLEAETAAERKIMRVRSTRTDSIYAVVYDTEKRMYAVYVDVLLVYTRQR